MVESITVVVAGGDDMSPAITLGEPLELEAVEPDQIRQGDVIVFRRYVLIAHRVLWSARIHGRTYFITRGDQCPYIDSPVDSRILVGRAKRKWRWVQTSLRSRILFSVAILWYIVGTKLIRGRAFRVLNANVRRVASMCLPKPPADR
ncbi:MAG: hypothetical protein QFX35_01200 [Candidatus Verstraetearchaeota archaeon]|nr:hypothetical protein [Candidatus Verstraetearchaeota archaeon]